MCSNPFRSQCPVRPVSLFRRLICLLLSEKRSLFSTPASVGCVRSSAGWTGHRRRSRYELRRNAATRSVGLEYRATTAQWHSNRRSCRPKVAENDKLRRYVQDRLGRVIARAASWCQTPRCGGWVAVMGPERIDGGRHRGAPGRSRTGFKSISPMMSPCESLTRRSNRRYMCKVEVR